MLIEDDNKLIDLNDIKNIFSDQILYDCNDPRLVGKFVVVVEFKDKSVQYIDKIFDTKELAEDWISEIGNLQSFEISLRKYKF